MNNLRIGICGWGNVATGLFRTLETNHEEIKKRGNLKLKLLQLEQDEIILNVIQVM